MDDEPTHLFVYGTLRAEVAHPKARLLRRHATRVGTGRVWGRLYDVGPYPALVAAKEPDDRVVGDVFALEATHVASLLEELDAYEGCPQPGVEQPLFIRRAGTATLENGRELAVWIYLYARGTQGLRTIRSGDWLARGRID